MGRAGWDLAACVPLGSPSSGIHTLPARAVRNAARRHNSYAAWYQIGTSGL